MNDLITLSSQAIATEVLEKLVMVGEVFEIDPVVILENVIEILTDDHNRLVDELLKEFSQEEH